MKILATIAGSALLTIALLSGAAAVGETIKVGTEGAYAPFNYVSASGQIQGFDYEIGQALCGEMKVECVWSTNEWLGIIPALQSKKFDLMIASMAITEARKQQVSFTSPYYFNAMRFVARKDLGIAAVSAKSLDGMVIGTQAGSVAVEVLKKFFPNNQMKLYPTLGEAFMDMENGRLDLVLESQLASSDWLAKDNVNCCVFVGDSFLLDDAQGTGIALRKEDTELLAKVNGALKAIMANGKYDSIRKKYFPFNIMERPVGASEYLK